MQCISNIQRTTMPNDVFMASIRLYQEMGKSEYYEKLLSPDYETLWIQHAHREAAAFYQCFFGSWTIAASRQKTLLLESTVARNKNESLYKNIISIFEAIHKPKATPFQMNATEIADLVKLLFLDVYTTDKLGYRKLEKGKHTIQTNESSSLREQIEELVIRWGKLRRSNEYEMLYLNLCMTVDLMNMEVFKIEENEIVAILIYYILALQQGLVALRYVSFFHHLHLLTQEYAQGIQKSRLNWLSGYADLMPLHRLLLRIFYELYNQLSITARDHEYEQNLEITKTDYIENTIDKLDEIFSKDDIRAKHPLISDSTINRTLKRLQEENKIRPLGKGRSAKWTKLYKKPGKKLAATQLGLDLGER
jgi:hypothetical protein